MAGLMIILTASLVFALALTPAARVLAQKTGSLDHPTERKTHRTAVPLLGGIGIYLSVVAAVLLFGDAFYVEQAAGILIGGSLISFAGLWDDHRSLSPLTKVVLQVASAALVTATGIAIQLFDLFWINWLVTILWFVVVSNAFNLADNMDGLSAGLAAIATSTFLVLSILNGQYLVGMLSAALLGACLGFLIYNFNPASIFMGDAGSLFLGFVIAAIGVKLRFLSNTPIVTWMIPVIVLAVPLFDIVFVVVSRFVRRRSIFRAGTDHVSHALRCRLTTDSRVVMALYLSSAVCGLLGIGVSFARATEAYVVLGVLLVYGAILFGVLFNLGRSDSETFG